MSKAGCTLCAALRLRGKRLLLTWFQSQLLTLDCSPPFRTSINLSDFAWRKHSLKAHPGNWAANALPLRRLRDRDLRTLSALSVRRSNGRSRHVPSRC